LLGEALVGQKKYAEAEPLLVAAYEGLKARKNQIPQFFVSYRLGLAGARIVQLYEAWGQSEKAAAWRLKLTDSGAGHPAPGQPDAKH
jgi:hypothetical protein